MKKYFLIIVALMLLGFTQCKPTPEGGDDDNADKVKVVCEIPINNGGRSDFTNLLVNGNVNWSNGEEYVYLAIHGDMPRLVELSAHAYGNPSRLKFEAEVEKGLIKLGESYDIWYFGNSYQKLPKYKLEDDVRLEGSIAAQSGRIGDLGHCHVATTRVVATEDSNEGDVLLNLNGVLKNQIAILLLDLKDVNELYGDAIVGTDYVLAYNNSSGRFELDVMESSDAKITVDGAEGISYIVLFPNEKENTEIRYTENHKVYECIIYDEIEANNMYYETASDGSTIQALSWFTVSSGDVEHGDHIHHYIDLGLPSGTLWATANVGSDTLYGYGNYYAWGEIVTKDKYTMANCTTNDINTWDNSVVFEDITGNPKYDVATAVMGAEWRMPTDAEQEELFTNCRWEPMKMPVPADFVDALEGYVNGYMLVGPNGNHIFLPAAGYRDSEYTSGEGENKDWFGRNYIGHYWSSTPKDGWGTGANLLHLEKGWKDATYSAYRYYGCTVRAVLKKKADEVDHDHKGGK